MIDRMLKLVSSIRFTLFLIIALSLLFLLGLWIPQKALLTRGLYAAWKAGSPALVSVLEAMGFTNIYTSPITLSLWVLFFINLSLVMGKRIPAVRRKVALPETGREYPLTTAASAHTITLERAQEKQLHRLPLLFRKAGYRFYGTPKQFSAVKNRLSPIATLFFHLSFFLMLLGGVISMYTRFSGTIDLAEGEVFQGERERYHASPRLPKIGSLPEARFLVKNIQPIVEQDTPTGIAVTLVDQEQKTHTVEVNRPYKTDHTLFVLRNLGVAPLLILQDTDGRELDGAYVKLNVLMGNKDAFTMQGMQFTTDFFPDYVVRDGSEGTRSEIMRNPAFRFHIEKDRTFIARRTVLLGRSVEFGKYRLRFPEMRYWVRFYVVKERGLGILYAGFGIATAALIWRLLFYRREIIGFVQPRERTAVLRIAGRAEFYKALFQDELERIARTLERELTAS